MTLLEDYSPIVVGDTGVPFAPMFQHKDGSAVDLTGATISMIMVSEFGDVVNCTGTWTIDNAAQGLAHYQYQAEDVAMAGMWSLYITVTVDGNTVHADVKLLQILPEPG